MPQRRHAHTNREQRRRQLAALLAAIGEDAPTSAQRRRQVDELRRADAAAAPSARRPLPIEGLELHRAPASFARIDPRLRAIARACAGRPVGTSASALERWSATRG